MSFEDIPEDNELSYPCNACDKGEVTKNEKGVWECSECDFQYPDMREVKDDM